jgi:GGDEF domain-containing protein
MNVLSVWGASPGVDDLSMAPSTNSTTTPDRTSEPLDASVGIAPGRPESTTHEMLETADKALLNAMCLRAEESWGRHQA